MQKDILKLFIKHVLVRPSIKTRRKPPIANPVGRPAPHRHAAALPHVSVELLVANFDANKWQDNLPYINTYHDKNDVLLHTTIIYNKYGIDRLKQYINLIWGAGASPGSVSMMQMLAHRLIDAGLRDEAFKAYKMSIARAQDLNLYRWVLSGYFYAAQYSTNSDKEEYYIKAASYSTTCQDAYEHKIFSSAVWLMQFSTKMEAINAVKSAVELGKIRFPNTWGRVVPLYDRLIKLYPIYAKI